MRISIVIPVYRDLQALPALLHSLQPYREMGHEVIVCGVESDLDSREWQALADHCVVSAKGRARQMNAGAACAAGDLLWFLHVDSVVPHSAIDEIWLSMYDGDKVWGRFDVALSGRHWLYRVISFFMNWRSALTHIATGDQGVFVNSETFHRLGGYPLLEIMEDIALSSRLRRVSAPARITTRLQTSSRRWEQRGILATVLLMWRMRLAYFFGIDSKRLAKWYE